MGDPLPEGRREEGEPVGARPLPGPAGLLWRFALAVALFPLMVSALAWRFALWAAIMFIYTIGLINFRQSLALESRLKIRDGRWWRVG